MPIWLWWMWMCLENLMVGAWILADVITPEIHIRLRISLTFDVNRTKRFRSLSLVSFHYVPLCTVITKPNCVCKARKKWHVFLQIGEMWREIFKLYFPVKR